MNKKAALFLLCGVCFSLFLYLIFPVYLLKYLPPEVFLNKEQLAKVSWIPATCAFICGISILVSYILCWRERKKISIWFAISGLLFLLIGVSFVTPILLIITPVVIVLLLIALHTFSFVIKNPMFLPKLLVYENSDLIPTLTEAERKALDHKVLKIFPFMLLIAIILWFLGRRFGF